MVLAVVLTALALLYLPITWTARLKAGIGDAFAIFYQTAFVMGDRVSGLVRLVTHAEAMRVEHEELRRQVDRLELEIADLQFAAWENDRLRAQVDFARRQRQRLMLGEVVARGDTSGWWQTLTLNRGTDSGVEVSMPVVAVGGLVGRVVAVSRRTSEVRLISDAQFKVSCRLVRTQAFGILQGGGVRLNGDPEVSLLSAPPILGVDYLTKEALIEVGDEVVTSGLGGVFPPGLPVGRVTKVEMDVSGLYQRAVIEPSADLETLRYVFVMML